jgi:hypothetical protein
VQLSIFDQALLSLVLAQRVPPGMSEADFMKIKDSLNDLFRITARSAYVASGEGQKGPADSKSQAVAMLAVLESGALDHSDDGLYLCLL